MYRFELEISPKQFCFRNLIDMDISEAIATTFLQNLSLLIEEKKFHDIKKLMKVLAEKDSDALQYLINRSVFKNQVKSSLFQRTIEINFLDGLKLLLSYGGDLNR